MSMKVSLLSCQLPAIIIVLKFLNATSVLLLLLGMGSAAPAAADPGCSSRRPKRAYLCALGPSPTGFRSPLQEIAKHAVAKQQYFWYISYCFKYFEFEREISDDQRTHSAG